jgi:hypothetical protein
MPIKGGIELFDAIRASGRRRSFITPTTRTW